MKVHMIKIGNSKFLGSNIIDYCYSRFEAIYGGYKISIMRTRSIKYFEVKIYDGKKTIKFLTVESVDIKKAIDTATAEIANFKF